MYSVSYVYYNYPTNTKSFDTYAAARGFFNRITRSPGVHSCELVIAGSAQ